MRSILCAISLCALLSGAETSMFDAIRNGDTARVQALLKSGADPNQRHEMGATALMYAAAFSTDECVRVLLDAGARGKWNRQQWRHCSHVGYRRYGQGSPAAGTRC